VSDTFLLISAGLIGRISTFSPRRNKISDYFNFFSSYNLAAVLFLAFLVEVAAVHVVNDDAGEIFNLDPADGFRSQFRISDDFGFQNAL